MNDVDVYVAFGPLLKERRRAAAGKFTDGGYVGCDEAARAYFVTIRKPVPQAVN
jgi:hypothetical protein